MTIYLLDVNVLLALSDPMHIHHEAAHRWFAAKGSSGWATCPITENSFVRIASHPGYPNRPGDTVAVLALLRQLCAAPGHHFWAADISLRDMFQSGMLLSHSQLTDVFLLGLSVHHGGMLASHDQRIAATSIPGGSATLELITP